MAGRLEGKVAIVTGAARGIGAATVRLMVSEGARVVATDLDRDGVKAVADALGEGVIAIQADVTDESAVAGLVGLAVERFGGLDVLHNNAVFALPQDTDTLATPDEVWLDMFRVAVMAAVYGCRHSIPAMTDRGGGSIVSTSSGAARVATGSKIAYGTAKAGLETMSLYTASMFGVRNIRSNVVAPGFVVTEGTREIFDDTQLQAFGDQSASGRACLPEDVAEVVVFLASDASRYVNGQVITVNGGGARPKAW